MKATTIAAMRVILFNKSFMAGADQLPRKCRAEGVNFIIMN